MQPAKNISSTEKGQVLPRKPVLIYDGECPVCRRTVEWIRARMDPDAFEFLSCYSDDLATRFPEIDKSACLEAMHLVLADGKTLIGDQAFPEILQRVRRYRWCALLFRLPGMGIFSRAFYRWFAARRMHISKIVFPKS